MKNILKDFYRKANENELKYYLEQIYPLQDRIFEIASIYENRIYLTGGTALSSFFFKHRLSEDLDFFTTADDLKFIANDLIGRLQNEGFTVDIDKLDVYFARFFIGGLQYNLKIEMVREFNLYGNLIETEKGIYVNNLEDIGANKITAFEDRAEIKDIIDLFFITEEISFQKLFEIADLKRAPIPYENLLAIDVDGISGKILTLIDIDENALSKFVDLLKDKTEQEIKKKEKLASLHISKIIAKILWDFPPNERDINKFSLPVLKRRIVNLPLPEKNIIEKEIINSSDNSGF